jgi:DnaJ domain
VDHYERLRVSRDAPLEVIRAAYRALAAKHHPDRHGQSDGSHFDMAALNGAYEVLSDPEQRAQYDAQLRMKDATSARAQAKSGGGDSTGHAHASAAPFDNVVDRDLADALSDIDWESLKSPAPINPWLTRRRLLPLAGVASLAVIAGVAWWLNDLTRQMEAERAISAHLGHMASAGVSGAASGPAVLGAIPVASAPSPASVEVGNAPVPSGDSTSEPQPAAGLGSLGSAQRTHMLDGEPLTSLRLDSRPNPTLQITAATR